MISFIIIDDEPIAHRIVEGYCEGLKHLKKVGNCYNALEAMEVLYRENVDLVFLDIKMPKMTGIEFLRSLSHPPKIIVTTAFKEHAFEGYELDIVDYLLKPFSFKRFIKAVNKIPARSRTSSIDHNISERISIKGDKKQHILDLDNILFIEAFGNYCKVHLLDHTITTHEKISSFEVILDSKLFMRVHKSYIVAKYKIQEIEGNRINIAGTKIPVGQTYKRYVTEFLGGLYK